MSQRCWCDTFRFLLRQNLTKDCQFISATGLKLFRLFLYSTCVIFDPIQLPFNFLSSKKQGHCNRPLDFFHKKFHRMSEGAGKKNFVIYFWVGVGGGFNVLVEMKTNFVNFFFSSMGVCSSNVGFVTALQVLFLYLCNV